MKISSQRQVAVIISIVASTISGVIIVMFSSINAESVLLIALAAALFVFITIYIAVYFLLNAFILEKINPIYKTIHSITQPEKNVQNELEDNDLIKEVDQQVVRWANTKSREIAKLKELEAYRKEFLGNVSHELKTPIFNIQGYILTLLDGGLEDASINRKYLERTEKSINRLISIVADLETISKLESKVLKLDLEKVNIIQLAEEVYEAQEMRAKKRDLKLTFDRAYEKPIWVDADKKKIYQALSNLVSNSISYGKQGGRTTISFTDMDENILVEVKDDGIGISKEDLPRIFERFYRIDKSRSRDQGGTGLGLAIVKHIIEAHNQIISVMSSVNEGTSFVFALKKHFSEK